MRNFGELKDIFNQMVVEGIATKNDDKKNLFKKYLKLLRENEILKAQFKVYNAIENMVEENEFKASEKIKANISLLEKYDSKSIEGSNKELASIIDVKKYSSDNTLHENITNLIFEKNNIDLYVDSLSETIEYVKTNVISESVDGDIIPNSVLSSVLSKKLDEKFSNLDETHKKIINSILESNIEVKEEIFNETIKECLDLVNEHLGENTNDINVKEKLLSVKEKLLGRKFNDSNFTNDITKILQLKEDLKK
jgi:hypothetical protein